MFSKLALRTKAPRTSVQANGGRLFYDVRDPDSGRRTQTDGILDAPYGKGANIMGEGHFSREGAKITGHWFFGRFKHGSCSL